MPTTILVVPCFNEAARLDTRKFKEFTAQHQNVFFLFVNDGSTDKTGEVLQKLHEQDANRYRLVELKRNCGKAEAVRRGMLEAIEAQADYVGFWDADLSTPLDMLPCFCDLLGARGDIEMVFGSRVQLLGRNINRKHIRHYLGRIFATLVSSVLNIGMYDSQCGAKLFRRSPGLVYLFNEPFVTKWIFDVEIVARLIVSTNTETVKRVVYEYPLSEWRDIQGSKIKFVDYIQSGFDLVKIYQHYIVKRSHGDGI
jgi:glycosyltransferase involved in cell wall biosynthesis